MEGLVVPILFKTIPRESTITFNINSQQGAEFIDIELEEIGDYVLLIDACPIDV